jgi:hypothetical protein
MNYYNFFKFLEDKDGREIPAKLKLVKKIKENPNYQLTQEDVDSFGFEDIPDDFEILDDIVLPHEINLSLQLASLSDGLIFKANVYIKSSKIRSLPNNLTVLGDLDISETWIETIGNNIKIRGNLNAETSIKTIGSNLTVGGNLYLSSTNLESLPKDLKVGGILYIYGTPFRKTLRNEYPTLSDDEIRQKLKSVFPGVNYIQLGRYN